MIKKILVVLLAGGIVFGLTGCSGGSKNVNLLINNEFTSSQSKEALSENWLMNSQVVQDYFSRKNLTIQSVVINNTYTEGRQSTAYVHIVAENDISRLSVNYAIESIRYDDDNWEVTNIYAEEKEIYFPVSDPDIDISFDDSEVVIERTEKKDTLSGDSIICMVYYTRVYDGDVACIKEYFYRKYYFDKETGEGWVYHDALRDECLGGDCELKTTTMTTEKNGEGKGNVYVEFTLDNNSITLHDLQAKAQSEKISLLEHYDYNNMGFTVEYYENGSRIASSPCENDYICEFDLYYNLSGRDRKATGEFFIMPDELWLRIFVPAQGYDKYNLISEN